MSSSEPWFCQVSIRWEFDNSGERKKKVQEVKFGEVIHNKADVELALRRAQAAVLNPNKHQTDYLRMTVAQLKDLRSELKFSRNTVCVQLSGPELTDLAFVDLPGNFSMKNVFWSLITKLSTYRYHPERGRRHSSPC